MAKDNPFSDNPFSKPEVTSIAFICFVWAPKCLSEFPSCLTLPVKLEAWHHQDPPSPEADERRHALNGYFIGNIAVLRLFTSQYIYFACAG